MINIGTVFTFLLYPFEIFFTIISILLLKFLKKKDRIFILPFQVTFIVSHLRAVLLLLKEDLGYQWKQADYSDVLVLAAHIGEKVNVLVASKSKDVHAGNVIKVLAPIVSGRGGGKPDMAMAGGSDANGIQDLLSAVAEQL